MEAADWNVRMKSPMDLASEAVDRDIIRSHGVSCHTIEAVRTAAKEPRVEIEFVRINPA
jgi:hypothetical protein